MARIVRELKTMDGNTAAAHASYSFTEVAAIYPITPPIKASHSGMLFSIPVSNIFPNMVDNSAELAHTECISIHQGEPA